MKKSFLGYFCIISTALLLSSCGGYIHPYRPLKASVGYSHTSLSENVFRVRFAGIDGMSREQVHDFAILRCAELVKEKEYSYFIMLGSKIYASVVSNINNIVNNDCPTYPPSQISSPCHNWQSKTTIKIRTQYKAICVIMAFKSKEEAHKVLAEREMERKVKVMKMSLMIDDVCCEESNEDETECDKLLEFEAAFVIKSIRDKYHMVNTCEQKN